MNLTKKMMLLLTFSANILLPNYYESQADIIIENAKFKAENPELVEQYKQAVKRAQNSASYQEYNTAGHTLKTDHKQIISRTKALKHVFSGALPLSNIVWNKLSVADFFDNCERTPRFDTPQCLLYNQLATEYSEKHAQLLSKYDELQNAYRKSNECLNLEALAKEVKDTFSEAS